MQELGDARAAAEAYKEWCADASLHTITIKGETYTAELTPKFDDFAKEDNYYKLLEDFNCYDCITEEAAPQRDVQQVYPENFEKILRDELKGQEGYRQKQEKNQAFDKVMAEIEGYLETHTKADTVYYAQQKGIKLSDKDKKLDAAGKEKLKQLQKDGARMKLPTNTEHEGYDTTNLHWAIKGGVIDRKNQAAFWTQVANIRKLGYNNTVTEDGEYAIIADNVIMFTDADFKAPSLSSVISVETTDKRTQFYVTRWIIDEINEHGSVGYAYDLVSGVYGQEVVHWYHQEDFHSDDWENGNREGKNGEKTDSEGRSRGIRYISDDANYKLPVGADTSPRALLANAFESVAQTDIEKSNLEKYRSKLADLEEMEAKLSELKAQIKELSFAEGKRDKEKINKLKFEANSTANRIETLDKILVRFEASEPIRKIIEREKEKVRVRTKEKVSEAAKNRREKERESMQKRDARAKLDKLVLDTVGWITAPKKGVVKCPDILKKPYMDFLNGIDTSSKTMAKGGDPTKADLRMANALGALTDTIEKITMGQDPSKESTDVFDSGYLDLPADFVKQLRDMTNKIRGMMENGGYVINSMTAQEVKDLAMHIRTLNHAIREMGTADAVSI